MPLPLIIACIVSGILLGVNAHVVRILPHDKIWASTILVGGSFVVIAATIAWLMNGFSPPSWWAVGYVSTVWLIAVPISNRRYRTIPIVAGACAFAWVIAGVVYILFWPH